MITICPGLFPSEDPSVPKVTETGNDLTLQKGLLLLHSLGDFPIADPLYPEMLQKAQHSHEKSYTHKESTIRGDRGELFHPKQAP